MLPAQARLRSPLEFRACVRHGVRAARSTLVVHARRDIDRPDATRVGFVVSRAVGGAVERNRVKRRLRHLAAARLATTPPGLLVVVRALPRAATAGHQLAADFDGAWDQAVARVGGERAQHAAGWRGER